MKAILHFLIFGVFCFSLHQWFIIPFFKIENSVPVSFQHLLLGGFSLVIYLVAQFGAEHYKNYVGFTVLGFLMLKMLSISIFIYIYDAQMATNPMLKYILLGFYFAYLIFLLLKIVPLINIGSVKEKH